MEFCDIKCNYKQIKDFKDYYITEYGDIYSTRLRGREIVPHLHELSPKVPGKSGKYLNIVLCNENGQTTKLIHRLVVEHFVDGYFHGAVVNHIDGNNRNNYYKNLEWTTVKDNVHKSYITSNKSAKRNYKIWELYDREHNFVHEFTSHIDMERFVRENEIDASPSQLTRKGCSRGYEVIKKNNRD